MARRRSRRWRNGWRSTSRPTWACSKGGTARVWRRRGRKNGGNRAQGWRWRDACCRCAESRRDISGAWLSGVEESAEKCGLDPPERGASSQVRSGRTDSCGKGRKAITLMEGRMAAVRAGYRDIRSWLGLAAEVEPLFGAMLDGPEFYQVLLRNIERRTAFCVREDDGPPGTPLLGAMLYSPPHPERPEHRIAWLAVAARSRRHGVGMLLGVLTVVTFGEENLPGRPARRLYERLEFHLAEAAPNGPEGGSR